jgi:hypothetical protein
LYFNFLPSQLHGTGFKVQARPVLPENQLPNPWEVIGLPFVPEWFNFYQVFWAILLTFCFYEQLEHFVQS